MSLLPSCFNRGRAFLFSQAQSSRHPRS
jgi:hypothetical protein